VDEVLEKDDWSEEDAKRFRETWETAIEANKRIEKFISDMLVKSIGD
jgi:hypothetical protein